MRGSAAARFDYLLRYEGGGSFRGTGRGEEHERKNGRVGGGWEDKANQTVNNRGTAERKGGEGGAGRKGVGARRGWRKERGGTTPRQLQNSPSFIVESHDSESPYIPRLLPFAVHPFRVAPHPLVFLSFSVLRSCTFRLFARATSTLPPSLFLFSLPLFLCVAHIYFYIPRSFLRAGGFHSTCGYLHDGVTPCAYYAYTSA